MDGAGIFYWPAKGRGVWSRFPIIKDSPIKVNFLLGYKPVEDFAGLFGGGGG